jgi:hypothetical protein
MRALDANGDGVIDEVEIANAPAALRSLDKNNDGKLTMEELRPPRPEADRSPDDRRPGAPGLRRPPGDQPGGPGRPPQRPRVND